MSRRTAVAVAAVLAAPAAPAFAHGEVSEQGGILSGWSLDPFVLVPLILVVTVYWRGVMRLRRLSGKRDDWPRHLVFAAGLAAVVAALLTPIAQYAHRLLTMHMVQHSLLTSAAPPLLLLARPLPLLTAGLPRALRRRALGPALQSGPAAAARVLVASPLSAWLLFSGAVLAWHVPALYEAAVEGHTIHVLEHASFLGVALLFWAAVLRGTGGVSPSIAPRLLVVVLAMVVNTALSAALTFSSSPWYTVYAEAGPTWGLDALEDQRLAGVVMMVADDLLYVAVVSVLLFRWIDAAARSQESSEVRSLK